MRIQGWKRVQIFWGLRCIPWPNKNFPTIIWGMHLIRNVGHCVGYVTHGLDSRIQGFTMVKSSHLSKTLIQVELEVLLITGGLIHYLVAVGYFHQAIWDYGDLWVENYLHECIGLDLTKVGFTYDMEDDYVDPTWNLHGISKGEKNGCVDSMWKHNDDMT